MIYLDYQATTPLAPEAAEAMRPWLETGFANPHSSHRLGREAAAAVEVARERVKHALSSPFQGGELYFTSGATEAINWALKGAAVRLPEGRRRIVTLATEHAAVLDTVEYLAEQGFDVETLPVAPDGLVDPAAVEAALAKPTGLLAAMLVNNEIGIVQPIAELGRLARAAGALFLCDAVQGFGRVPVPLGACDLVAVSAHKVHGPKGIGALWVRDGVVLDPLLHGGGQEGGLRSGTLSPALCVGFGEAARLLVERGEEDRAHVERLWATGRAAMSGWTLNGSAERRYRGNLNLRREGVDAARLISELRGIAFSAGSACASGSGRPSHVLAALGLADREARSSIRLGFGRYTTEEELAEALALIDSAASRQPGLVS
ncbi:MAG TPA: cysteine desulfurase family protein [Allosphingosinicella sp.]|nr:cysteine desulfurase family protein [Allosphingosinicella sp.]